MGGTYIDLINFGERLHGTDLNIIAQQSDYSVKKRTPQESCGSVHCVISEYDSNVDWVKCDTCMRWFHLLCEGYATSEVLQVKTLATYSCLVCSKSVSNLDSLKKYNLSRLESLREKQTAAEQEFFLLRDECFDLKKQVDAMVGPLEKQLLKVLDDIKVNRQAYHGNVFVGNHCKIILKIFSQLCDVISKPEPETCKKMKEVFGAFSGAHHFMTLKKLLTDEEINYLCHFCEDFGSVYPKAFPESPCLTRKMHELIFHVPNVCKRI